MSLSISIRFLTGRAHLHPWQTHHSEGRVEWPPSHWRLLRALVAIAGRGLTSLPYPDEVPPPKPELKVKLEGISSLKKRGVPKEAQGKLSLSKGGVLSLKEPLTDAEADAWKLANPGEPLSTAMDGLRTLASKPQPGALADVDDDEIPISRLARLLAALSATPAIWLPKTAGGHTRQYFPIHEAGIVMNSGSAVFDTFATVRKDQPLVFHWPKVNLDAQPLSDLKLILGRLTYFGRAESWSQAEAHSVELKDLPDVIVEGHRQTHWRCVCIEDGGKPVGKEYRDFTLERTLAPCDDVKSETASLLPRTKPLATASRPKAEEDFLAILNAEGAELSLLRCVLRESGQDIKDGLERPIGTRWIHYAVPRAVYDVPRPSPRPKPRAPETVDLVVYALNTATVHRPVLPALTDTLLVADRFRSAMMALCKAPSRSISGHEADGAPCQDHRHAFWWPTDENNDGFIEQVIAWAPGGFENREVDALRRFTRLRQRGGRPDLLVTPVFVGQASSFPPWRTDPEARVFVSATPYFCPIHLSHGKKGSGRLRSIKPILIRGLQKQKLIATDADVATIEEFVFDFDPKQRVETQRAIEQHEIVEPISPRQCFPVIEQPSAFPSLPRFTSVRDGRFVGACAKDPDDPGYPFGLSLGLYVDKGNRFIRSLSFCRRRRRHEVKGQGRMFRITFQDPRAPQPFALGDQCHFGLGLFVPEKESESQ